MAKSPPTLSRVFNTKRVGPVTGVEKNIIEQFVADQPREVTPDQIKLLARLLRRSPNTIRHCIDRAREDFVRNAERYVEVHHEAVETALACGVPKSLEVAMRGSQWAMENISAEGVRIVDKPGNQPSGIKVYVGVQIGGLNKPAGDMA